ncbi:MAG: aminotransferase class I/II-fold pyridoxal phosphate-dependent enzyme, partial [Deltaproteobacteria bacterium]|nr:aminotransferase class I/II-fold pyridoxal phosphate-dependent enzyme [Deltaproteobacteria bacterium]
TNLPVAILNRDDILLYPDPGYPLYNYLPSFAYAKGFGYPLTESEGFQIDIKTFPREVIEKSKAIIVNYPSNPLAATTDLSHLREVVEFARRNNIIVIYDNTYCEIAFDGYRPPSIFEVEGAKEIAVELHSFSKTYNLPGIRLGFFAGNRDIIRILSDVKSNIDFGVFKPFQKIGAFALKSEEVQASIKETVEIYRRRRDIVVDKLNRCGFKINKPKATFYIFARLPDFIKDEDEFVKNLILNTGVVVLPGTAFGTNGKGYIRIALVREEGVISDAIDRISKFINKCT